MGLMLGLLVGGGFFILKLDTYFRELSMHQSQDDTENKEDKEKDSKEKKQDYRPVKKKTENSAPVTGEPPSADSLTTEEPADKITPADSLTPDSLMMADKMPSGDEIIVRKDELLSVKTIELINLTGSTDKNPKDSLLQKVSGVRDDQKASYKIEYWKSPINYKGYKMTRNKLVLYGISSADPMSLFRIDDDIYMKHLNTIYRLGFTNDFRQFEKVSDPTVQARLNK